MVGANPLGTRDYAPSAIRGEIVGIVEDIRAEALDEEP